MPRVLFIGDIVGRPGRNLVINSLAKIKKDYAIDIVVANAENAAGGSGITSAIAKELYLSGVNGITLGDHTWDQNGFEQDIDALDYVCRPANLSLSCPGRMYLIIRHAHFRLGVISLLGRQFMYTLKADCPFQVADKLISELKDQTDAILVDIHAEATSEKVALGWYLDGRVSLVVGTHTHIPTADTTLLPKGTAYQTDAGMSGPYESVLGRDIAAVIARFKNSMPQKFTVAKNNVQIRGCWIDIDPVTYKTTHIEPFIYK